MSSRTAVSALARLSPMAGAGRAHGAARVFGVLPSPVSVSSRGQKSTGECGSPLSAAKRMFSNPSPKVSNNTFSSKSPFNLMTKSIGAELDYRMEFAHPERGDEVSPWHDLPHQVTSSTFAMVNEIPKGQRAKMEVQPREKGNPIKQDVKKGKPRYFEFGDIPFNYGMIPQTWEDPRIKDKDTGCKGDGDPLDVVEISNTPFSIGGTHEIKVLGALGLVDEGEMDWKIVAVDVHNPLAEKLHTLEDVDRVLPGTLKNIRHWFTYYKVPEGKGVNEFAFEGAFQDADFATKLIDKHHKQYTNLIHEGPQDTNMWTPPKKNETLRPSPKSY